MYLIGTKTQCEDYNKLVTKLESYGHGDVWDKVRKHPLKDNLFSVKKHPKYNSSLEPTDRLSSDWFDTSDIYQKCTRCGTKDVLEVDRICRYCLASNTQPDSRKLRQSRIDYLTTNFKNTPVGNYINEIIERYAVEVKRYEDVGSSDLAIAVADESTSPYSNYLSINIPTETMGDITVRQGILVNIFIEPSFVLGGEVVDKADLILNAEFTRKVSRNINTAMDVYFTYKEKEYGVRFQDWNIFNTLTDKQCEDKLQDYIFHHSSIETPAKPLEI